jgi:hypothetical protein
VPEEVGLADGQLPAQGGELGLRVDLEMAQVGGAGLPVRGQPAAQRAVQLRRAGVREPQAQVMLDQIAEPAQVGRGGGRGD